MIGTIIILALFIGKGDLTIVFAHVFGGATMLGAFLWQQITVPRLRHQKVRLFTGFAAVCY